MSAKAFRLTPLLKVLTAVFLTGWILIAAFPIFWVFMMSLKVPLDSFSTNPLKVIFGPKTLTEAGGLSVVEMLLYAGALWGIWRWGVPRFKTLQIHFSEDRDTTSTVFLVISLYLGTAIAAVVLFVGLIPLLTSGIHAVLKFIPGLNLLAKPLYGITFQHYYSVWVENTFYHHFINSIYVTLGVVAISLTVGALAAYALARANSLSAFWILVVALIFRSLPHSVIVTGYLQPFIDTNLYGNRLAIIMVLVAINQPFTIWMLRSFFANIPTALDESALVDGCSRIQAFWHVIVPVMWPGIITTGLFSFLLAYNDYLVTSLLLDGETMTMVPAIAQYFNFETTMTDQVQAIAAAASITFPLLILVLLFQKQIVSGLVSGAVKE